MAAAGAGAAGGVLAFLRAIYSMELRRLVAYRVDFWVRFVGTMFASVTVAWFLWDAVFASRGITELAGYTLRGMVLYYLLVPLVESISRCGDPGSVAWEIYDGGLTRYLLYPVPFFPVEYARALAYATIGAVQLVLVLVIWRLISPFPGEMALTPLTVAQGVLTALWVSMLNFALRFTIELLAFWIDQVWNLNVMMMFIVRMLGGAMVPLALFPEPVLAVVKWTPFPWLLSFPIRVVSGQVGLTEWLTGLAVSGLWTLLLAGVATFVWRRGRRVYTGVGI